MDIVILDEITKKIKELPESLQRQVLVFVDTLQASSIRGTPGKEVSVFAGTIPLDDLSFMTEAIEAGCEQVDAAEW